MSRFNSSISTCLGANALGRVKFIAITLMAILGMALLAATSLAKSPEVTGVHVGFEDHYKVGFWTPMTVEVSSGDQPFQGELQLIIPDGDGVNARYTRKIDIAKGKTQPIKFTVKFGRRFSGVTTRLVNNAAVNVQSFAAVDSPANRTDVVPTAHASHDELYLQIGGDIGLQDIIAGPIRGETGVRTICNVTSAQELPTQAHAYDGVSLIAVATAEESMVDEVTDEQWQAIAQWVKSGGRLLLSVGSRGDELLAQPNKLGQFAPGRYLQTTSLASLAGLEQFVRARNRLDPTDLQVNILRDIQGAVLAAEKTGGRELPTVISHSFGIGNITFVAFDLEHENIAQWKDREGLIYKLAASHRKVDTQALSGGDQVIRVGYTDLAGQLRGAMEQFPGVTQVEFLWIAMIVGGYVLLIGPIDYFLLKRFIGRMEFTWITFPLVVLAVGALAVSVSPWWRGGSIKTTEIELLDFVYEGEDSPPDVYGAYWAAFFTPASQSVDFQFEPPPEGFSAEQILLSWNGMPGESLSGMGARFTTASPATYDVAENAKLKSVPLLGGSTFNTIARWSGKGPSQTAGEFELAGEELTGYFRNPLQVDLLDGVLFFGDEAFACRQKISPGGIVKTPTSSLSGDASTLFEPKKITYRLARKRFEFEEELTVAWDVQDNDINRILEIMTMHEAAGGKSHTKLTNGFYPWLDATHHIEAGKAVFIARAEQPLSQLTGPPTDSENQRKYLWCRFILPVTRKP